MAVYVSFLMLGNGRTTGQCSFNPCGENNLIIDGTFDSGYTSCMDFLQQLCFSNGSGSPGQTAFQIHNSLQNTPDLIQIDVQCASFLDCNPGNGGINWIPVSSNMVVHAWSEMIPGESFPRSEGIAIELDCPIPPGSGGQISIDAAAPASCAVYNPQLIFAFSSAPPLSATDVYVNPGIEMETSQLIDHFVVEGVPATPATYATYTIPYKNNTTDYLSYLIVYTSVHDVTTTDGFRVSVVFDNVALIPDPVAMTVTDTPDPIWVCPGQTGSIAFDICNDTDCDQFNAFGIDIALPAGITHVANADFPSTSTTISPYSILAGQCKTLTLAFLVENSFPAGVPHDITLEITGENECTIADPVLTSLISVDGVLTIEKHVSNTEPMEGDQVTYMMTVCNTTGLTLNAVHVTDILPPGLVFPISNDFTINGNTLTALVDLAQQECLELVFIAMVHFPDGNNTIINCAQVILNDLNCSVAVNCVTVMEAEDPSGVCDCPPGTNHFNLNGTVNSVLISQSGLPDDQLINGCVSVQGVLEINENYKFIGCDIRMYPGASIVVNTDQRLIAQISHLHGCEQMWRGIEMEEASELKLIGCQLEDARYMISTGQSSVLWLDDNEFAKNYAGIFNPSNITFFILNKFVDNEIHCENLNLLPPYPGQTPVPGAISYTGMLLNGLQDHVFGSVSNTPQNVFHHMANGVISSGCYYRIRSLRFHDMIASGEYTLEGYGIRAINADKAIFVTGMGGDNNSIPSFERCATRAIDVQNIGLFASDNHITDLNRGIRAINATNDEIEITGNEITANISGIQIVQCQGAQSVNVSDNHITIPQSVLISQGVSIQSNGAFTNRAFVQGNAFDLHARSTGISLQSGGNIDIIDNQNINLNNANENRHGIRIENSDDLLVSGNHIFGQNTTAGGSSDNAGISVTASTNATYCCNEMHLTRYGAQFQGICNGTDFKGNTFDRHDIGLHLFGATATLGMEQDNTGNIWLGNVNDYTWMAKCESSDCGTSEFLINETTLPWLPPPGELSPNSTWFLLGGNNPTFECTAGACETGEMMAMISGSDEDIATENLSFPLFEEELTFEAQRYLYKKLAENPELTDASAMVEAFWTDAASGSIGFLQNLDDSKETLLQLGVMIESQMASYKVDINTTMDMIGAIDLQMPADPDDPSVEVFTAQKKALSETYLFPATGSLGNVSSATTENRQANAVTIKTLNDTAPDYALYEYNEKVVNEIYLSTFAQDITELSAEQIGDLTAIAQQCPMAGGKAVYTARSLVSPWYEAEYHDEDVCAQLGYQMLHIQPQTQPGQLDSPKSLEQRKQSGSYVQAWPNPASTEITVNFAAEQTESLQLDLSNALGQKVYTERLPMASGQLRLEVESFPSGIYMLVLTDLEGCILANYRFTITH